MRRIYLDGNSLGPPPPGVREAVVGALDDWERLLIDGWNEAGWVDVERRVARALAPLLGARERDVACTDSTTVNLFQALVAAARLRPDRRTLVVEQGAFPTDLYAAGGAAELAGLTLREVPRDGLVEDLDDVAVVSVGHVDYRTGHRVDLRALTGTAHDHGALVVADLAHAAGAIVTDLAAWDVDLAVGCTYKFLNGGPGAPGWIYANPRHHAVLDPAIRGWFGHASPFDFDPEHRPAPGASRFRNGTPPILSMVAVAAALEAHVEVDAAQREAIATTLTTRFLELLDQADVDLELLTPREAHQRGAQLSFRHPQAHAIVRAMHARGVVGDHRPPDIVRLGFSPLVVTVEDVEDAVAVLVDVLTTEAYTDPAHHERGVVP